MMARIAHTGDADPPISSDKMIRVKTAAAAPYRCRLTGDGLERFFFGYAAIEETAGGQEFGV